MDFIKNPEPVLYCSDALYAEMLAYARSTDLEMTMILSIDQLSKYEYEITKINIPPQWNESAETKTIDSQYNQWCFEQIKNNIKLNGHLHTHPKMSVSPSGYDENFYNILINATNTYQFRLILNQQGNIRVDIIDMTNNYKVENIGLTIKTNNLLILVDNTNSPIKNITLPHVDFKPTRKSETDEGVHISTYNHAEDTPEYAYHGIKNLYDYAHNKEPINITPKQNTKNLININDDEYFPTTEEEEEKETEENSCIINLADCTTESLAEALANKLTYAELSDLIINLQNYI